MNRFHTCALLLSLLAACGGTRLNRAGSTVALSEGRPGGTCEEVDDVVGRAGGTGVAGSSRRRLAEYALNHLRNQAASLGATHVTAGPILFARADGEQESATVTGTAYRCISVNAPRSAEEAARRALMSLAPSLVGECASRESLSADMTFGVDGRLADLHGVEPSAARACLAHQLASVDLGTREAVTLTFDFGEAVMRGSVASTEAEPASGEAEERPDVRDADAERVRQALDAQRDDVLACVAADRAAIRASTSGGRLHVRLHGPLAGTPEEVCVQALFADTVVGDVDDLEVIHLVR